MPGFGAGDVILIAAEVVLLDHWVQRLVLCTMLAEQELVVVVDPALHCLLEQLMLGLQSAAGQSGQLRI